MGRIFKTPSDDTTEETLRMMHTANMVDITYERTMGWNLWEDTGNWIKEKLTSWSESIFD